MSTRPIVLEALMGLVVLACWFSVLGLMRMRNPVQAMHHLTLPATIGMLALLITLHLDSGVDYLTFKTVLIAFVLLAINSVVTHATGRAFRARDLGHWKTFDRDLIEWDHKRTLPEQPATIEK